MKTDRTPLAALLVLLLAVVAAAGPALAQDPPTPQEVEAERALDALKDATRPDAETTWDQRWYAYDHAKKTLSDLPKDHVLRDRYARLQPQVSQSLRRDAVPGSGVLMGIVGAVLLWGGFFFCLAVALRKDPHAHDALETDETWPLRPE